MNITIRMLVGFILCLVQQVVFAEGLQLFLESTFINPASMVRTENNHLGVGATLTTSNYYFSGTIGGTSGSITSHNSIYTLPNLQLYHRVNCTTVIGLAISQPVFSEIHWPPAGFQNFFGIDAAVRTYEVAPMISYSFSRAFTMGIAFRYNVLYDAEVNFNVPGVGFELNRAYITPMYSGAIGFSYTINDKTFLEGSYFAPVGRKTKGISAAGNFVNQNFSFHDFQILPSTFVLGLTRIVNDKILVAARASYSIFKPNHNLILENTAAGGSNLTIFPIYASNSYYLLLYGQYQITPKTTLLGFIKRDQSTATQYTNVLAFPAENQYGAGVGAEYHFTKNIAYKLLVGQTQGGGPGINNPRNFLVGSSKDRFSFVDTNFTINF